MASQKICESWASIIRHIREVNIPADEARIKNLESLLAALSEEDVDADTSASVQTQLDAAKQALEDDQGQLEGFSEEYEAIGCTGRP